MSFTRAYRLLSKDLLLGPRSPFFLYALVLPVALTIIFQLVFGSLFEPKPRMGIVDADSSEITASLQEMGGIQVTLLDDADELKTKVERNDLDAGLVLPAGFDAAVRAGAKPPLELYIGGESRASDRLVLSVTTIDLVRQVEGAPAPVVVDLVNLGEEQLPISVRLVPLIMLYAVVMAGIAVPASSMAEEREKGTLNALLVTPARISEFIAAKGMLGLILTVVMSIATLAMNNALGPRPFDMLLIVVVSAIFWVMIGLVVGTVSTSTTMMFSIIKGAGIFLFAPVIFYIIPEWPQWIAKLFPTYWALAPVWNVAVQGGTAADSALELGVTLAIAAAQLPLVALFGRRMRARLAAT